jgi:4-hydroxybenzoate polyprenyltransferase
MSKSVAQTIVNFVHLISAKQTLLGLPYVITAMVLAAQGWPSFRELVLIVLCTVSAGAGSMALNRLADARLDARNPRTINRVIPTGKISRLAARIFVIICFAVFVFGASLLNRLAFWCSPIPIIIFIIFAYGKRFTSMTHYLIGVAMGLAPIGAWVAVQGDLDYRILFYAVGVLTWYVGFDIFYALQDVDFFRKYRLYSIPSRFGNAVAILTARSMHLIAYGLFFLHGGIFSLGLFYFIGLVISGLALLYEHYMVSKYGIMRLNKQFFYMNVVVSVALCAGTLIDLTIYGYRA